MQESMLGCKVGATENGSLSAVPLTEGKLGKHKNIRSVINSIFSALHMFIFVLLTSRLLIYLQVPCFF